MTTEMTLQLYICAWCRDVLLGLYTDRSFPHVSCYNANNAMLTSISAVLRSSLVPGTCLVWRGGVRWPARADVTNRNTNHRWGDIILQRLWRHQRRASINELTDISHGRAGRRLFSTISDTVDPTCMVLYSEARSTATETTDMLLICCET